MKVMAIDFGTKRTGVAVSDEGGMLARPLTTLPMGDGEPLRARIATLAAEHRPAEILVGNPRRLDGSPGTHAAAVAALADALRERLHLPVTLWDEALTTIEAHARLLEGGAGRRKRRESIDRAAAAVLLQDYLDTRAGRRA